MTIFGFNTDIKFGDIVYHVQSEERRHDSLLQTQVFVRGRCIGKHASSYASIKLRPDFTEEQMHELLKAQHKTVVDAVRAGRVEEVLRASVETTVAQAIDSAAPGADPPTHHSVGSERAAAAAAGAEKPPQTPTLELQFVNPENIFCDGVALFRFRVTDSGSPVGGAHLVVRFQPAAVSGSEEPPMYAQCTSAPDGSAEIHIQVPKDALHLAGLLVQATHSSKIITRKFRLIGK